MNLHAVVANLVGAVNPLQPVTIRISIGETTAADGSEAPAYATPGTITASIGGTFTASAAGTTLTVASVLSGSLQAGDEITGTDGANSLAPDTTIVEQLSGIPGGAGEYEISVETDSGILESCTVTSASTVLDVSAIGSGVPQSGQTISDMTGSLLAGTLITGQLSGSAGASGLYSINQQQTVASEAMTLSMVLLAQIQPLTAGELRHMDMLNLQGTHRALYVSAPLHGIQRPALKGGDMVTLPDGSVYLVTQPLESFYMSAGWQKVAITLQDGS